jgi:esterase FrsA
MPSMNPDTIVSGRPKTLTEAKTWMLQRLAARTHPMNALPLDEGPAWIDGVPGLDGESWGGYWGALGDDVVAKARGRRAGR